MKRPRDDGPAVSPQAGGGNGAGSESPEASTAVSHTEASGKHDTEKQEPPPRAAAPTQPKRGSKFEIQFDADWREKSEGINSGSLRLKSTTSRYKYAMVCSSNVNRSVKAQIVLNASLMSCKSYGVGTQVKLPGKDQYTPKVFPFGTPYADIYDTLEEEDSWYFERNGVLRLMARDACVKRAPERWQDVAGPEVAEFDVVLCFENRIFDLVVEDMQQREPEDFKAIHLIAMSVNDSPEEAEKASVEVLELCKLLEMSSDLDLDAANIIEEFQAKSKRPILHQVVHL